MVRLRILAVCLAPLAALMTSAHAQETNGALRMQPNFTCAEINDVNSGDYNADRRRVMGRAQMWVAGYLSGVNQVYAAQHGFYLQLDALLNDGVLSDKLKAYCSDFPNAEISQIAELLIDELGRDGENYLRADKVDAVHSRNIRNGAR